MIYQHIVPTTTPRTTVNKEYYVKVLKQLRQHVQRKRPAIAKNFILHQDNAPCHNAFFTRDFFEKWGIEVLEHPPYSPDLAPCDYYLFPTLKKALRGRQFTSDQEASTACKVFFESLPEEAFRVTICDKWVKRWSRCIRNQGRYFEKDKNVNE